MKKRLRTCVAQGEREASGLAHGGAGSIALQKTFLRSSGVPLTDTLFDGTINLNIAPRTFTILQPDHVITMKEWGPGTTETFHLLEITLSYRRKTYPAYIYYPLPSPIKAHPDSIIEVLAQHIPNLHYGGMITISFDENKLLIR